MTTEMVIPVQILVVEDNEANLDVIRRRLSRRGYVTAAARNGRQACDRVHELRPLLVLMDLEMPIMSGFEALAEIRAIPALAGTRVVALTAHATNEIRRACDAAGFDDFLTKPIDFAALFDLISWVGIVAHRVGDAPPPAKGAE
jgi:CheY-like chemotaxis protein